MLLRLINIGSRDRCEAIGGDTCVHMRPVTSFLWLDHKSLALANIALECVLKKCFCMGYDKTKRGLVPVGYNLYSKQRLCCP